MWWISNKNIKQKKNPGFNYTVGSALKRNGVGHITLDREFAVATGDGDLLVGFTQT